MKSLFSIVFFFFFVNTSFAQTVIPESISIARGGWTRIIDFVSVDDNYFALFVESTATQQVFFYEKIDDDYQLIKNESISQFLYGFEENFHHVYPSIEGVHNTINDNYVILVYDWLEGCDQIYGGQGAFEFNKLGELVSEMTYTEGYDIIADKEEFNLNVVEDENGYNYSVENSDGNTVLNIYDEIRFNSVEKVGDYFLLLGKGKSFAYIKFFDVNGATNNTINDIAITNADLGEISDISNEGYWYYNHIRLDIPEASITIENVGETLVEEVVLRSNFGECTYGMYCPNTGYSYITFNELVIEPGQSQSFTLPSFFIELGGYSLGTCDTFPTHCVSVVGPNGKLDVDYSNNEICVDTQWQMTTSSNQLNKDDFFVPNFFNEELNLKSEIPMRVEIYSISGKRIFAAPILGNEIIATNNWQAGMYIVNLFDDKGNVYSTKVIKN